jgi:hypothetical protein
LISFLYFQSLPFVPMSCSGAGCQSSRIERSSASNGLGGAGLKIVGRALVGEAPLPPADHVFVHCDRMLAFSSSLMRSQAAGDAAYGSPSGDMRVGLSVMCDYFPNNPLLRPFWNV